MKQKAIICDIDGCLLDTSSIHQEIEKKGLTGADKWAYFERNANSIVDIPFNYALGSVLESLAVGNYKIILLTARCETIRQQTRLRLSHELACKYSLYMRPVDDLRSAAEVKEDLLKNILNFFDVHLAIDDEDENIKMFQKYNILAMKAR